jgi:hypothetical protein
MREIQVAARAINRRQAIDFSQQCVLHGLPIPELAKEIIAESRAPSASSAELSPAELAAIERATQETLALKQAEAAHG